MLSIGGEGVWSHRGQVFTGQMTRPTVSKHGRNWQIHATQALLWGGYKASDTNDKLNTITFFLI